MKRFIAILLCAVMLCGLVPAFAVQASEAGQSTDYMGFSDLKGHWAEEALTHAVENGLLKGYDGKLSPNDALTRAQLATIVVSAFGATEKADISHLTDVSKDAWYYPETGMYLYASTEEILTAALLRIPFHLGQAVPVKIMCGELLKIDARGNQSRSEFDTINLVQRWYYPCSCWYDPAPRPYNSKKSDVSKEYLRELKSVASFYGFSPGYVDSLLADGFTTDDVEEMLYAGEL